VGVGVIAKEKIAKGEVVIVYGGLIVPKSEIMEYNNTVSQLGIQVNEDFFHLPSIEGRRQDRRT
jgi:SET domain-containing protein